MYFQHSKLCNIVGLQLIGHWFNTNMISQMRKSIKGATLLITGDEDLVFVLLSFWQVRIKNFVTLQN